MLIRINIKEEKFRNLLKNWSRYRSEEISPPEDYWVDSTRPSPLYYRARVSRRFVRKTSCQDDISSGWPDDLGCFVRNMSLDLERFVRTDSC